jgi:ESS family glutamate:Na+ symporter
VGGKSFGLTIAALGFLSAAIGGVIHLNLLRKTKKIKMDAQTHHIHSSEEIEAENEIPMQDSMDKMTVQVALVAVSYLITYILMVLLGSLLPGMKSVIYGFNFLLGVLSATLVKFVIGLLRKAKLMNRGYLNNFLLTRISNFFFDLMVVAGVAAIRLDALEMYWGIMLILGIVGLVSTYVYNYMVAKRLFPEYPEEQFLMMYGMLTGTASTGTILLREIDGEFKTPAADNMVYQNFPAIVFGFPMMLLATLAPQKPVLTFIILVAFFAVMNVILFRSFIFKKKTQKV